ncbi:MAG: hypothetical protein ABF289_16325, partial [Clostridiales bacterium]
FLSLYYSFLKQTYKNNKTLCISISIHNITIFSKNINQPVKKNAQPHHASNHELYTRVNQWYNGFRVRFWVDKNSIKFYNEQNVFRVESTINNHSKFKIYCNK